MTPSSQIIAELTATKTPLTTAGPSFTPTPRKSLDAFLTHSDPVLENAKRAAACFLDAIQLGEKPLWLSLVGTSGTGKTMLAKLIKAELPASMDDHETLLSGIQWRDWNKLLNRYRQKEYSLVDVVGDANMAFLDDIGASMDTEFATDMLLRTLSARVGKWTVITSNLNLVQIAKRFDTRVTSRMVRDKNVVVELKTHDYALRTT